MFSTAQKKSAKGDNSFITLKKSLNSFNISVIGICAVSTCFDCCDKPQLY